MRFNLAGLFHDIGHAAPPTTEETKVTDPVAVLPVATKVASPAVAVAPAGTGTWDKVFNDTLLALSLISELAPLIPGASAAAGVATILDKIVLVGQSAYQAHVAVTGQPLDLTKLHRE